MNKNTIFGLVIALIVVLIGFYYFNIKQQNNNTPQIKTNTQEESQPQEEMTKIKVEASEFEYNPSTISVKKGEKVALTFKNVGKVPHNFVSDELNVQTKTLNPGEEETVNFTAEKSGSFAFYCSIGSHRSQGMEGEVTVE